MTGDYELSIRNGLKNVPEDHVKVRKGQIFKYIEEALY